jgi:hypothetical protein
MATDITKLIGQLVDGGHVVVVVSKPEQHGQTAKPQPVTSEKPPARKPARRWGRRDVGPWASVSDQEHRRRAASFGAAHLRHVDRRDITHKESFDFYCQHEELVRAAVRAYHQLRKRLLRGDYIPRPSCWDAAFVHTVLDGVGDVDEVSDFVTRWASMDWTLESIGVVQNDISTTVDVFQKMFRFHRNPSTAVGA